MEQKIRKGISRRTDFVNGNTYLKRMLINKSRREICFRILCSIGNPKIWILRSKSVFPNRMLSTNN